MSFDPFATSGLRVCGSSMSKQSSAFKFKLFTVLWLQSRLIFSYSPFFSVVSHTLRRGMCPSNREKKLFLFCFMVVDVISVTLEAQWENCVKKRYPAIWERIDRNVECSSKLLILFPHQVSHSAQQDERSHDENGPHIRTHTHAYKQRLFILSLFAPWIFDARPHKHIKRLFKHIVCELIHDTQLDPFCACWLWSAQYTIEEKMANIFLFSAMPLKMCVCVTVCCARVCGWMRATWDGRMRMLRSLAMIAKGRNAI